MPRSSHFVALAVLTITGALTLTMMSCATMTTPPEHQLPCPAFPTPSPHVATKIHDLDDIEVDRWMEALAKLEGDLAECQ